MKQFVIFMILVCIFLIVLFEIFSKIYINKYLKKVVNIDQTLLLISDKYIENDKCKYSYYDIENNVCVIQSKENYTVLDELIILHEYGHFLRFNSMKNLEYKLILNTKIIFALSILISIIGLLIMYIGGSIIRRPVSVVILTSLIIQIIHFMVIFYIEVYANVYAKDYMIKKDLPFYFCCIQSFLQIIYWSLLLFMSFGIYLILIR